MTDSRRDPPLIGRVRERAVLEAAVAAADAGAPGAVLVAGEAGVGKTRLVRSFLADLPPSRALVLRAQCVDLGEPGIPYLAVLDVVRAIRATAEPEVVAVLDRYPLVTAWSDRGRGDESPVDESRRLQLFEAMAGLVAEVGRVRGPLVVAIDDLQWVDGSSADVLRFLVSRLVSERVVVVATVRSDGLKARPSVRRLVSELSRLPWVDRLDLEPFGLDEVAEYLALTGPATDPDVAEEVFRLTRGNPSYVHALASDPQGLLAEGDAVPEALADLLLGRLDGLPDAARTVVRAAAVVTHPVADPVLRHVAGLSGEAMDEAIRTTVSGGVLQSDGTSYAFVNDLLRAAVHDDLLPGERARLHAKYAAALQAGAAGPASAAEVAHHVTEAQDAAGTLVWSLRAGDEALQSLAPGEALAHLGRALAAWQTVDDAPALTGTAHGRVAILAARAAGMAGEPWRAIDLATEAVHLSDADGDPVAAVEARADLVRLLVEVDAGDRAVRPGEEAVRLADEAALDPATAALAHVALARALLSDRRVDEARAQADRALDRARAAAVPALELDALTTAAFLDELAGDVPSAASRLGSTLRLARAEDEPLAELRAHYALASLHYYNGDVAGALPVLRTAMRRVSQSGLRWSDPGVELRLLHAVALYVSGDLDASLQAADAPESPPPDVAAARLGAVACYAAVAAGRPDAERRLAALAGSWDADPQVALLAGGCEADRLTWLGDHVGAVAVAERAQNHLDDAAGEGMYGGLWLSALGLAALADEAEGCRRRRDAAGVQAAVGQGAVLRQRVERIVAGGRGRPGDLGPEGLAWHRRALAEHARLTGDAAIEEWRRALDAFGYGHVYEQARCRWRLAEALVAAGDRDGAREHAQAAATTAARMGAAPLQAAIAASTTRARLAPARSATDGVLTDREREVLALVAEGLSNREIGNRLFISAKTASVHLSNVMTKLDAASRTEAVTVAQRRGLIDVI